MSVCETKSELLSRLDELTRGISVLTEARFTTAYIARDCHISRSLASHYLNELVRSGQVVKVEERPVLFFHKKGIERYLRTCLESCEFDSLQSLYHHADMGAVRDFDKAIGFDIAYSACVDQLKGAVQYPPHGLPIFLVGEHGTGKQLLSELTFEYGLNRGILPSGSSYVSVDCARYENGEGDVESAIFGKQDKMGAVRESAGGVVYIHRFDHLSHTDREVVLQRLHEYEGLQRGRDEVPRFILSTARSLDNEITKSATRSIPVVVSLPRLIERSVQERNQLALHFLRIEGRRMSVDILISRGALRSIVEADYKDNVDGMRSCVINCCASAFLNLEGDKLIIKTCHLPSKVFPLSEFGYDEEELIDVNERTSDSSQRVISFFQRMVDPLTTRTGADKPSFIDMLENVSSAVRDYADYMNFEDRCLDPRIGAYEQVISRIIEEANRIYGVELSRRISHSLALSVFVQTMSDASLSVWRQMNRKKTEFLLTLFSDNLPESASIVDHIALKTKNALGVRLDSLSSLLLLIEIEEALKTSIRPRAYLGVIMCHGYSTASSIAGAADRILHEHVFEAIDMAYEQEASDVFAQLSRLLIRFSHCKSIAILVDTGSLESVSDSIADLVNCDVHIMTNVSTGLAVEVGASLIAGENLDDVLPRIKNAYLPKLSSIRRMQKSDAVLFCSESGSDAADRIRRIVQESISQKVNVEFVTCDYDELVFDGIHSPVFDLYRVRAIVGTMDPGVPGVPFVALEDILCQGNVDVIDRLLFPLLGPDGMAEFHANLLKSLTLRNVVESITILNPEMLYFEADRAVRRLSELTGFEIDSRKRISVYVHLCGLIERLITNNFVDNYPQLNLFEIEHSEFINWFRTSFGEMSQRYRVEIPLSEIAYVYRMLKTESSNDTSVQNSVLEDE